MSSFTAGETVTLPLYLAGALQREISPQIQVLSTLVRLASVLLLASPRRPAGTVEVLATEPGAPPQSAGPRDGRCKASRSWVWRRACLPHRPRASLCCLIGSRAPTP